jgi:flagellar hook-basal body complex protein FliE
MVDGINNFQLPNGASAASKLTDQSLTTKTTQTTADGKDFKSLLMDNLNQVNKLQQEAQTATEKLTTGETDNVAEVFSAVRKADVAFSLLMQIRNQLVDAYTEIKNIKI